MILVHHLENSRSQRLLWLLEELGAEYDLVRYERDRRTMMAPPEMARIHPLGKSPTVEVDGLVLIETGAIVEYLVETRPNALVPKSRDAFLRYRMFIHYAEGSMMPPLLALLVVQKLGILGRPARPRIQSMIDKHLDWLESELEQRPWFSGEDFSAADIMLSFPLEISATRAKLGEERPRLREWLKRISARPAYTRALARGGPYAYA